jgi:dihydroxy-acid dehydratase
MKRFLRSTVFNKHSRVLTEPVERTGAQAMLYGLGLTKDDMKKPQIGVGSMWFEGNPCNAKLDILSAYTKSSLASSGLLPFRFNTVGVSDGMSMGTHGMKYSLPSRDIIADSIETIVSAQHYDGLVCIPGCDKNLPGSAMALLRINRPGCIIYGGSMQPQFHAGQTLDIVSAFESYGKYISGEIDEYKRDSIVQNACDSKKCGSCSGLYTANTMAIILEVLGLMVPNGSSNMSLSDEKLNETSQIGEIMYRLLRDDIKPRDIVTKESFLNAAKILSIVGGSTNAVIHLLAMARNAEVPFTLDDIAETSNTPVLLNMKPHGDFCMSDMYKNGGTRAMLRYAIEEGFINGNTQTITGNTLWDNVKNAETTIDRTLLFSRELPFKDSSHIHVLYGNMAPHGCLSKMYSEDTHHYGTVIVFDSEDEFLTALKAGKITKDHFVVLRFQGETVGCPEMLTPTSALIGYFGKDDAPPFATDGRFSGGSTGILIAHLPDAYKSGSPTARLKDGDHMEVCLQSGTIEVTTKDNFEMRTPNQGPVIPVPPYTFLHRFCKHVGDIQTGFTIQ